MQQFTFFINIHVAALQIRSYVVCSKSGLLQNKIQNEVYN